jgi:hypothetical protein
MPPPAFATNAEFADRTGLTLDEGEQTRADNLLARVATEIQAVAGQTILQVTDEEITMSGTTDRRILLPQRPVVSVSSVMLDGTELNQGNDYFVDGDELVRRIFTLLSPSVIDAWTFGRGFGFEWQTLEITYTHGYEDDEIPGILKEISCEAVARAFFNPATVARETIGDTTTTFDNARFSPTGLRLTGDEKNDIRRLFGMKGGSIPMKD